jgi:uncharacterized protein (TIGR00730 family)
MQKRKLKHVAVFCGASNGADPAFAEQAFALGAALAKRGVTVVYGGGRAGLMGRVADGALTGGGRVIGVITKQLADHELAHLGLAELHVVDSMHERKMKMADLAEAFIALPGGFGTLDELFEIAAWAQLGLHHKPIGLLNTSGFYEGLMRFLDHAHSQKFLRLPHTRALHMHAEVGALLDILESAEPTAGLLPRA